MKKSKKHNEDLLYMDDDQAVNYYQKELQRIQALKILKEAPKEERMLQTKKGFIKPNKYQIKNN